MVSEHVYFLPTSNNEKEEHRTKSNSVVIIGPNGSGKSKLGAWIEQAGGHNAHRIASQRGINPSKFTPLKSFERAENVVLYGSEGSGSKFPKWGGSGLVTTRFVNDFDDTLAALLAQHTNEIKAFRNECLEAEKNNMPHPSVPQTKLDTLFQIWSRVFPHRGLEEKDSQFIASFERDGEKIEYSATEMSDGERSVLYLASQVLCISGPSILIVDEPEVHLHRSLVNRIWSALEEVRQDCLFVYITHDVEFAVTRKTTERFWIKSFDGERWDMDRIPENELPQTLLLEILGNRKDVLFVEGEHGSLDAQLYSILFPNWHIVPCGSCANVISYTKTFQKLPSNLLESYNAYGLIDRDYRSDEEIEALSNHSIFCLKVAEVENLFIVPEVIEVMSEYHLKDSEAVKARIADHVINLRLNTQIEQQTADAVVAQLKHKLTMLKIDHINIESSFNKSISEIDIEQMRQTTADLFQEIIKEKNYPLALKHFNSKGLSSEAARAFGFVSGEYIPHIIRLANGPLRNSITKAMMPYLPKQLTKYMNK